MKRFVFYLLLLLTFASSFVSNVVAQSTPPTQLYDVDNTCNQGPNGTYASLEECFRVLNSRVPYCKVGDGVFLDTCDITEKTEQVIVRFYGYRDESEKGDVPEEYGEFFCYKSDQSKCEGDDFKTIGSGRIVDGGIIAEEVCGDGSDALKGTSHKRKSGCQDEDYFHEGKIYRLGLYHDKNKNAKIAEAAFYIKHYYPEVIIDEKDPREKATLTVRIKGLREAKNKAGEKQNNYKLLLQGRDSTFSDEACVAVDTKSHVSPDHKFTNLSSGKYQLKVQERVKEDGGNCHGGFTYLLVPITIGDEDSEGKIGKTIKDPNGVEDRNFSRQDHSLRLPCDEKDRTKDGRCLAVTTGIGRISVQPDTFVASLYGWLLSLAGVAGLILLLRAGYKILTSGGNKEKVGEARDEIRSVILGILFLVVALVILETIGTDLLRIPGFVR